MSPAQDLVITTTRILTFDLVPDGVILVLVATLECAIGISLLTGIWLRLTVYLLGVQLLGILSPLILLPERLFAGPIMLRLWRASTSSRTSSWLPRPW